MKTATHLRAVALILATSLSAAAFAGPPGKAGIPDHPKEALPERNIECTPKPGTESMNHDPQDHPMPKTRGMKTMDPAQHMLDCVDLDAPEAPDKIHDHGKHKKTGSG
jgi:hypothetical protein